MAFTSLGGEVGIAALDGSGVEDAGQSEGVDGEGVGERWSCGA